MMVLAWYIDLNDIENKEKCEIFIMDIRMVSKRDDTSPTLV